MTIDETYWRQRSRAIWLKKGDRNSKFFHKKASNRKKRNRIKGLRDEHGVWQENPEGIEGVVIQYFHKLFSRHEPNILAQEMVLQAVHPRVTPEINQILLNPYSTEEVKLAFFQMHPSKAPGPDVSHAVISFLTTKEMPHDLNFTHVVLIPKVKEVQDMSQLRPIALCNVIYKIASKVLANRLKQFLLEIISPQQSAFVPDRLISDNTLVASELAHYMHVLRRGQEGFMVLKLDISKAYDWLDWDFLVKIMTKMGFASQWMELIQCCLSTVRYSFLINGMPRGYVTLNRGLRQGDPISSYLFLFCAEALSALIANAVSKGVWHGFEGVLLYARASLQDCALIRQIMKVYEDASGQQSLADYLGMPIVAAHDKYLGIPTRVRRSRNDTFAYIKDNLTKKLTGWRTKLLSAARREILIKGMIQELHQLCAKFWWGGTYEKRGMHWRAWDALCKPKAKGGMGFHHLFAFNLAMLAKQGWWLLQYPSSLPGQLLKAIYFPHCNFWEAELGKAPSYAWRSILEGRDTLRNGIQRLIGDGMSTNVWADPWLMGENLLPFFSDTVSRVSDLFVSPGVWDVALLSHLFLAHIVHKNQALPISSRSHSDKSIWALDRKGLFTVKSAYHIARTRVLEDHVMAPNPSVQLWNKIWNAPVPVPITLGWWEEFKSAIVKSRGRNVSPRDKWITPSSGYIKLNVDGAYNNASGMASLGGVFHAHTGSCLGVFMQGLFSAHSARHSELMALLAGVQAAIQHNLYPLTIETDCLVLVSALTSGSLNDSELGFLIEDLWASLSTITTSIRFVRRSANRVTHVIAKEAFSGPANLVFTTDPSRAMRRMLSSDYNDV
ncbi:PREDICTED: putative ribonuclease H protein At1g65750-like [Fragaria vesca subsp. vesca]